VTRAFTPSYTNEFRGICDNYMENETALQALIAKYRDHAEFEERDMTDINQQCHPDDDALIHLVARIGSADELDLLARSGARVNAPGDMGFTPLHNAAGFGRTQIVEKLLALSADPDIQNEGGRTPEEMALSGGYTETARLLERYKLRNI